MWLSEDKGYLWLSEDMWLSEDKGHTEDVPDVVKKRHKTGKLGPTNHTRQCYQPPARNNSGERQNEVEMGASETKIPNWMHEGKF
jgi:hypothetical protein